MPQNVDILNIIRLEIVWPFYVPDLQSNIPAGTPGHYTATISGYTTNTESSDSHSLLYMYLNGQQVDETLFASGYHSGGQYLYYDQGSRTMVSHTDKPKLKLKTFCSDLPHERGWHTSYWGYTSEFFLLVLAHGVLHIADGLGLLIFFTWFELEWNWRSIPTTLQFRESLEKLKQI